eukprot:TRINITY_DN32968_c0_g1_i1.p1 TRINITY_DN32968_c0_g1~~TRINITY_DN32968_c0_g1_i1.p1  ORF type:complete len:516 (-),score=120.23 TRINITY_DN32968_c0_g1_i1:401-1948(-)
MAFAGYWAAVGPGSEQQPGVHHERQQQQQQWQWPGPIGVEDAKQTAPTAPAIAPLPVHANFDPHVRPGWQPQPGAAPRPFAFYQARGSPNALPTVESDLVRLREELQKEEWVAASLRHHHAATSQHLAQQTWPGGRGPSPADVADAQAAGIAGSIYGVPMTGWAASAPSRPASPVPALSRPSILQTPPPAPAVVADIDDQAPPLLPSALRLDLPPQSKHVPLETEADAAQRHRQVAESVRKLYLEGGLKGFEVLEPNRIFLLEDEDEHKKSLHELPSKTDVLELRILGARRLRRHGHERPDPFVVARVGQREQRTVEMLETTNPSWEEDNMFSFFVALAGFCRCGHTYVDASTKCERCGEARPTEEQLFLEVMDARGRSSLGRARILIEDIPSDWQLRKEPLSGDQGELLVELRLDRGGGVEQAVLALKAAKKAFDARLDDETQDPRAQEEARRAKEELGNLYKELNRRMVAAEPPLAAAAAPVFPVSSSGPPAHHGTSPSQGLGAIHGLPPLPL